MGSLSELPVVAVVTSRGNVLEYAVYVSTDWGDFLHFVRCFEISRICKL